MIFEKLRSPVQFLKHVLVEVPQERMLQDYEAWWEAEGRQISDATDRAGTPWLRMFDRFGNRVDEVLFPPEYWKALKKGYQAGVVWMAFEENSLLSCNVLHYLTSFYDPGL
ncbi:MAG: acyl-CoA dehydrogenase, partial [Acidobacteria bacterium]|nr:acyl-CoA dehydrogenase [Acidobacteriota bacterium]